MHIIEDPMTRVRVKKMKEALNGLIKDIQANLATNGVNSRLKDIRKNGKVLKK